jgi:hypothetical protein
MVSLDAYMGGARQTKPSFITLTHTGTPPTSVVTRRSGLRASSACWVHRVGVEFSRRQNS